MARILGKQTQYWGDAVAKNPSDQTAAELALAEAQANRDETARVLAEANKMLAELKKGAIAAKQAKEAAIAAARESDMIFASIMEVADKADKAIEAKTIEERAALNAFVHGTPADLAATIELSTEEAAAIIGVSTRTMARAKEEREAAENPDDIPGFLIASIPFIPGSSKGTFSYLLIEIQNFFRRRVEKYYEEGIAKLVVYKAKKQSFVQLSLDFQEEKPNILKFMESALAESTWPFSIQEDGTPICFFEAFERGLLNGNARRLTIREYGSLLADAASARGAREFADELGIEVREPPDGPSPAKTI